LRVTIRPYNSDDLHATVDIFLRAIKEVSSRDYSPEQIAAWAKVDDLNAWGAARFSRPTWIAVVDDQPVGFTDLTDSGLLDMMFVHPKFQGVGIASRLLARVESEAHAQGIKRIHTEASKTARPFFEKKGFVLVRAQRVEKRGQILENFLLEEAVP